MQVDSDLNTKWRFADDGHEEEMSIATAITNEEPSLTVQSGKDDADINVIVKRFGLGAQMPEAASIAQYGDFSEVADYQSAIHQVMAAEDAFMALPPDVRSRFGNDPGQLWLFLHDPSNLDEARELGLVQKAPLEPSPMRVEVVNQPAAEVDEPVVKAGRHKRERE